MTRYRGYLYRTFHRRTEVVEAESPKEAALKLAAAHFDLDEADSWDEAEEDIALLIDTLDKNGVFIEGETVTFSLLPNEEFERIEGKTLRHIPPDLPERYREALDCLEEILELLEGQYRVSKFSHDSGPLHRARAVLKEKSHG